MRSAAYAAIAVCALTVSALAQESRPAGLSVGVVAAERKPITKAFDFVGRVDAINRVDIKARVTGYLESVNFKEGSTVKEGEQLYHIEDGLFKAAVSEAEGALDRSKAAKVLSAVQLQRAEDLLAKNVGTAVARDQAFAADEEADGTILINQANLDTAKINLGYTDITSPISGKIGKTNVTKGNVVSPQTGVLTTIVSQDPMYVTFPVSQRDFLRAQETGARVDLATVKASIRFADGRKYDHSGSIDFVDVTVDRTTDTVLVRGVFPNPEGVLIDGQLVRIGVDVGNPVEKVVVPQSALIADQQGVYVFIVDDGKAAIRRLKIGDESGTGVIVNEGLKGGEQVIVEGLQGIRPGTPVTANPVPPILGRS